MGRGGITLPHRPSPLSRGIIPYLKLFLYAINVQSVKINNLPSGRFYSQEKSVYSIIVDTDLDPTFGTNRDPDLFTLIKSFFTRQ